MGEIAWWQDSDVFYTYEEEEEEEEEEAAAALGIRPQNSSTKTAALLVIATFDLVFGFNSRRTLATSRGRFLLIFKSPIASFSKMGSLNGFLISM